ncbi:MAG: GNAT family N-acetyltransferase [Bacteroidaceae bacterium]|nr:GNAT family N-acetyltransferase [Bacteroidaceae bacterium]
MASKSTSPLAEPAAHVRLRKLEQADAPLLLALEQLPDVRLQTPDAPLPGLADVERFIAHQTFRLATEGVLRMVIDTASTDTQNFAGVIDLTGLSTEHHHAEIGIALRPDMRWRGIGKRAVHLMERLAQRMELHTLTAQVMATNSAALALFDAAGYERVGRLPEYACVDGAWTDVVLFSKVLDTLTPDSRAQS